jgi:hypothetical protein
MRTLIGSFSSILDFRVLLFSLTKASFGCGSLCADVFTNSSRAVPPTVSVFRPNDKYLVRAVVADKNQRHPRSLQILASQQCKKYCQAPDMVSHHIRLRLIPCGGRRHASPLSGDAWRHPPRLLLSFAAPACTCRRNDQTKARCKRLSK